MKKKTLLAIILLLGVFFPLTSVKALTKINFAEKDNGQINTTIHFEEGFVGAIDVTFKVSGNVYVEDFKFSEKIASSNYGKSFSYNKEKKTLNVRVTAGGTGTTHNLLNSKKELSLGSIIFSTSAEKDTTYKLSESSLKIVDNNWASKTIQQSHITLGDKTQFTYKVKKVNKEDKPNDDEDDNPGTQGDTGNTDNTDDKEQDDKDDNDEKDNNTTQVEKNEPSASKDKTSSNTSSTKINEKNNSTSKSQNNKSASKNTNTKEAEETDSTDSIEEDTDEDNNNKSSEITKKSNNKENKEEKDEFNWPIIIIIVLAACTSIGIYIFTRKKED